MGRFGKVKWAKHGKWTWTKKSEVINFNTTRHSRSVHLCTLQCETLEVNIQSINLGVVLSNNLSLEHEVIAATNKSSTILGVLRIQLRENNSRAWLTVYNSLIRLKYYWFTALSQRQLKQKKSFERARKKGLRQIPNLSCEDSVANGWEFLN